MEKVLPLIMVGVYIMLIVCIDLCSQNAKRTFEYIKRYFIERK